MSDGRSVTGMAMTEFDETMEILMHIECGDPVGFQNYNKAICNAIKFLEMQPTEIKNAVDLDNDTFGEWLKSVKEQNGYTLKQMAQIAGVSYYSIQKYVTEHMPPTLDSVMRITKAFGKRIIIM